MLVYVTGKNVSITDALKGYAIKKIGKLQKYIIVPEETTARVLIRTYKNYQKAEVTIPTKIGILRAEATGKDAYAAIDESVDKLAGQIRKQKTRLEKRHRSSLTDTFIASESKSEDIDVKTKEFLVEKIDLDEAILRMELSDHDFYAYLDEDTEEVSIVYRRKIGGYGVLETHR